MNNFVNNSNDSDLSSDINSIVAKVLCGLAHSDNPFKDFPWDTSKFFFCQILNFGMSQTPSLVTLIARLCDAPTKTSVLKVGLCYLFGWRKVQKCIKNKTFQKYG